MGEPKNLLAYAITEPFENHTEIVFARHRIVALRRGAAALDLSNRDELGGLSCRRAPWADAFAEQGAVPASAWLEQGWSFDECSGCGMRLTADDLYERDLTTAGVIGSAGGAVYCCAECFERDAAEDHACKEAGENYLVVLRSILNRRFPNATIVYEHVYVPRGQDPRVVQQAIVDFEWPGQKIGPAGLHYDFIYNSMGPAELRWVCCFGDRSAFEAYAASTHPLPTLP